jgi:hypothetical protein
MMAQPAPKSNISVLPDRVDGRMPRAGLDRVAASSFVLLPLAEAASRRLDAALAGISRNG